MIVFFFLVLAGRLLYMQVFKYRWYNSLATENYLRLDPIQAVRGNIYDRSGHLMVGNIGRFDVSLMYANTKKDDISAVVNMVSSLLGVKAAHFMKIISRYEKNNELYMPIPLATNVDQAVMNKIAEHAYELPGVFLSATPERVYPYGDLAGQVLGYTSDITSRELKDHPNAGYNLDDQYGRSGLENSYQTYLRGKDGVREIEVNARGQVLKEIGKVEPVQGDNLVLNLSVRLEKAAQNALTAVVKKAQGVRGNRVGGGAVVLENVHNGKILALASYPSFDPAVLSADSKATANLFQNPGHPLLNRALTAYPPGSTFKLVDATAALESGVVKAGTKLYDPGYFRLGDHIFHNWYQPGFGWQNIVGAIQVSNDTFFWKLGAKLGWRPLAQWARAYGLGQPTGIDIPGEATGVVPTPAYKQQITRSYVDYILKQRQQALEAKYGGDQSAPAYQKALTRLRAGFTSRYAWDMAWHEYDTLNMAIGQGYNLYTPLQLADYTATLANGGTLYRPYLVDRVVTPGGKVVLHQVPTVVRKLNVSGAVMKVIHQGMALVTQNGGTAAAPFAGFPVAVAGKTGTAQAGSKGSDSLFIAYAPAKNPQVAAAAVVEHAGEGNAAAAPVVRDVLAAYFHLHLPLESYNG